MARNFFGRTPGWLLPTVLLTAHVGLLLVSSRLQFPTRNEVAHVPAGLSYWDSGSFRLYSVNPPLWKMIATLPTLLLNPKVDGIPLPVVPGQRAEWEAARRFADDNSPDYFDLIWSARLAGILWSVLGGIIVYRWAGELYDRPGGLLALTVWCFGPNVLAHAPLVTPDIPATVAGLAATYTFWKYLRTGSGALAVAAGVLLGVAQLTKFTLLVLYGVWPVLAVAHALDRSNTTFRAVPIRTRLLQGGLIGLFSIWVINLGYGFAGSFTPLEDYAFVSRSFTHHNPDAAAGGLPKVGNRFCGTWIGTVPIPLPVDYLTGFDVQRRDLEGENMQPSYLAGEWRKGGWWYYYLYGLAVKVPLGTWGLALWGLVLTVGRSRLSAAWADELALWLPVVAILTLVSSQTGFNHHLRYVLPLAPFVCVATGKLAGYVRRETRMAALAVLTLLGWSVVSSLSVYPHSLSYFNALAGGPDRGCEHLIDSNIDWGQDLFFFKAWVERHPDTRSIGLAYHTCIDYRVVGAEYGHVPQEPCPGWFGVDVRNLMTPDGQYRYFRRLTPVSKAGYSIFIYHVSPDEADRVRRDMGLPPLPSPPSP